MKNTHKFSALALIACMVIVTAGCKKPNQETPADEMVIKLPPGLIHIGAQWVDGKVWVESFDPITNACLLRQYDAEGKVVEGSAKVRLKACRIEQSSDASIKQTSEEEQTTKPAAKAKPASPKQTGKPNAAQGVQP